MLVVQLRALNTVGLTLGAGLTFIFFCSALQKQLLTQSHDIGLRE